MLSSSSLRVVLPSSFLRHVFTPALSRAMASANLNRPAPPPLPQEQQREFEDLVRTAQTPLASSSASSSEDDVTLHPDTPTPIKPEFEGQVNPVTGEHGGPKREPVNRWGADPGGDWSFKGRVSDF